MEKTAPEIEKLIFTKVSLPASVQERAAIEQAAVKRYAAHPTPYLTERQLWQGATEILAALHLDQAYTLYTMVAIHNTLARPFFERIPYQQRLLLLPHCLRHPTECPGILRQGLLQCVGCGRCVLAELSKQARDLGYNVLISEDASSVLEVLIMTGARAVLGVSCLKTLWKVFPWVAQFGLYGQAVPLLTAGCRATQVDLEQLQRVLPAQAAASPESLQVETAEASRQNAAQMRHPLFAKMFALLGPAQDATEKIAHEWVTCGGKRVRSFLVLCIYTLLTRQRQIPDTVLRVALAIELFHKASLIHDDIEDDEARRYGRPTLHRQYSTAVAINIGDYLVGKGYQLLASAAQLIGAARALRLVECFAQAHTCITRGQGQELLWNHDERKQINLAQIENIYAWKTSRLFEIAGRLGLILAEKEAGNCEGLCRFSRNLGIAYQIIDDIGDYQSEAPDAATALENDIVAGKPTILYALALQHAQEQDRMQLQALYQPPRRTTDQVKQVIAIFKRSCAFQRAQQIYQQHYQAAQQALEEITEPVLRRLLADLLEYRIARKAPFTTSRWPTDHI